MANSGTESGLRVLSLFATPYSLFADRKVHMLGRLNHVAIAVPDIAAAARTYRDTLGAKVSAPVPQPDHGVTTVFIELPNTKIELLEPLGEKSPIASFLAKNPKGGIHHVCYEVEDIEAAFRQMIAKGATIITPVSSFYGGYSLARFRDPWSNLWWLYAPETENADVPSPESSKTDWHDSEPSHVYTTLMQAMRDLRAPEAD